MHLRASIGTGKAPMNPTALRFALSRQRHDVVPQVFQALHPFGQTPAFKNADLNLRHIQLTAMLGRVMHLQSLPDALRFLGRKRLVEAGCRMCVEIIHHQADHPRLEIDLIDQPPDGLRKIQSGALLGQLHTAASVQPSSLFNNTLARLTRAGVGFPTSDKDVQMVSFVFGSGASELDVPYGWLLLGSHSFLYITD